tara:strand:- start:4770 stop:5213 length:444 start_codon:yes stop_codon:yes gene_type:complete
MKITKQRLKQIIKEEMEALMPNEEDLDSAFGGPPEEDIGPWPDPESDPDMVTKRINTLKVREMVDDLQHSFPRIAQALAASDYETLAEMAEGLYTHHQQGRLEGSPHMQLKALLALNRARYFDPEAQALWDAIEGTRLYVDIKKRLP